MEGPEQAVGQGTHPLSPWTGWAAAGTARDPIQEPSRSFEVYSRGQDKYVGHVVRTVRENVTGDGPAVCLLRVLGAQHSGPALF